MKKIIISTILLLISFLSAQSIRVTGEWNYTIPSNDIMEAGEDFSGTYESNLNQVYIDIEYNRSWRVYVNKNNIDWNDDIRLAVKRTGDGIGSRRIQGGKNYKVIRNSSNYFFRGERDRFYIPLQYRIQNISVLMPANTYVVEIVYTLQAN